MNWKTVLFYMLVALVSVVAAKFLTVLGVEPNFFPQILYVASGLALVTVVIQLFDSLKQKGGTKAVVGSVVAILFWGGLLVYANVALLVANEPFNVWVGLVDLALLAFVVLEIRAIVKRKL